MAEALGVASGIVGIVSLGIQLTSALLKYYGSYKDRDSDVSNLCLSLGNLSDIFNLLSKTIEPPAKFEKSIKDSVEKNINHVVSRVKILEEELEKVQDAESPKSDSRSAMRRHMRRAYYPFKEGTLIKIQQTVADARDNLQLSLELLQVGSISTIHADLVSLVRFQEGTKTQNILNWLSSKNFRQQQEDFLSQRHPGTGQHLLRHPEFLQWAKGDKQKVWCKGGPGVGKTILASTIIEFLEGDISTQDVGLAFLYCDHKSKVSQTTEYFIGAILRQLVERRHTIPARIDLLHQKHREKGTTAALEERLELLRSLAQDCSDVYIVIDALDECIDKDSQLIWNRLLTQLRDNIPNLYLLYTSRTIEDVSGILADSSVIDVRADSADIRGYVLEQIRFKGHLDGFCQRDPKLKDRILEEVVQRSDGMFLVARLYIESLALMTNLRAIKRALGRLPTTIDGNYDEAMERIQQQPQSTKLLGLQALLWIVYAERPLELEELQHGVAIDELEEDDESVPEDCLTPSTLIINACVGLIKIDEKSNVVRLIHTTAQEYFDRRGAEYFPNPHESIGRACLTYLMLGTFGGPCSTDAKYADRLSQNPLFQYAARNSAYHIRKAAGNSLNEPALNFLLDEQKLSCSVQTIFYPENIAVFGKAQTFPMRFKGIHYASHFGLTNIAQLLLEIDSAEVDSKDSRHQTPLSYAAAGGNEQLVRLLLDTHAVEVDARGWMGRTPLLCAAKQGHASIVELLLNTRNVDADLKDWRNMTPLSIATVEGHTQIVELLLNNKNVDVNSKDSASMTPLSFAALHGHEQIVRLLLSTKDTDVNCKDSRGMAPLSIATVEGHTQIVELLLNNKNVDVNSKDSASMTPLSFAALHGHEQIVRLLLSTKDTDVNCKDSGGMTPLSIASVEGRTQIVELLLKNRRVDVNSKDLRRKRTPLLLAIFHGHGEIVELLLKASRVHVSAMHLDGTTPLLLAVNCSQEEIVKLLLRDGRMNINEKSNGSTPLSLAALRGDAQMVKLILNTSCMVDVNSKDSDYSTPLSRAAREGHEQVVKLLLDTRGVDVNSKDIEYLTPLSRAAREGHKQVVKLLLDARGVDVNSKNMFGETPLMIAVEKQNEEIVRLLLNTKSVEVSTRDREGNSALSIAMKQWDGGIRKLLLETERSQAS